MFNSGLLSHNGNYGTVLPLPHNGVMGRFCPFPIMDYGTVFPFETALIASLR